MMKCDSRELFMTEFAKECYRHALRLPKVDNRAMSMLGHESYLTMGPPDELSVLEAEEVFEAKFGHVPTPDELQEWLELLNEKE